MGHVDLLINCGVRGRKLVHRRGAENAEATQREEGKREIEEKGREEEERRLSSRDFLFSLRRLSVLCASAVKRSHLLKP
jgi:hypothetical protein